MSRVKATAGKNKASKKISEVMGFFFWLETAIKKINFPL